MYNAGMVQQDRTIVISHIPSANIRFRYFLFIFFYVFPHYSSPLLFPLFLGPLNYTVYTVRHTGNKLFVGRVSTCVVPSHTNVHNFRCLYRYNGHGHRFRIYSTPPHHHQYAWAYPGCESCCLNVRLE